MNKINEMRIDFFATEENVAFARAAVSAFLLPLNPPWRSWRTCAPPCPRP